VGDAVALRACCRHSDCWAGNSGVDIDEFESCRPGWRDLCCPPAHNLHGHRSLLVCTERSICSVGHRHPSGYRAFKATTLSEVVRREISSLGYSFQIEVAWNVERSGAANAEVPITFVVRVHGNPEMSLGIVVEAIGRVTLWGVIRGRRRVLADPLAAARRL